MDKFVAKVVQMYETFNVRFGAMLVEPAVTTVIGCSRYPLLRPSDQNEHFQVIHAFNPKCIKMGELHGEYNSMTNEDGWSRIDAHPQRRRRSDPGGSGLARASRRHLDRKHEHGAR